MSKFVNSMSSILILLVSLSSGADDAATTEQVSAYAHKLVSEALSILNSPTKESREAKLGKARELINQNLAFESMADGALPKSARVTLSSSEKQQFLNLYKNYVGKSYTNLIKNYTGTAKDINIVDTERLDQNNFKVNMTIANNEQLVRVSYLVRKVGSTFKVFDINTEGVSLVDSQRNDFSAMISSQGFDALLEFLREKSQS